MTAVRQIPKGVVFDMDGVLLDSARIHARAWKETFDDFLAARGRSDQFTLPDDYRNYVDGRPRYEGVASFLLSREIDLPHGDPSDAPGMTTITGVGNLKNEAFHRLLEETEVEPFDGVVELLDGLRGQGAPLAVVSSSRNTSRVLPESVRQRVDLVLGGEDLVEMQIPGKPAPDMFLKAAEEIGVIPTEAAVIEDAPAGVRAGRRAGFSLVVGVDPERSLSWVVDLSDIVVPGVSVLPGELSSWMDLLRPPPLALDHLETIRRMLGSRSDPVVYIGEVEAELLKARQQDGVGVLVSSAPYAMTWADFSVRDEQAGHELRAALGE